MSQPNSSYSSSFGGSGLTVYVCGHGKLPDVLGKTFIPHGMTVVFYARVGEELASLVGGRVLQILHGEGPRRQTGDENGSVPVPNYLLTGFDDAGIAMRVQLAAVEVESTSKSMRVYFVGGNHLNGPIKLCSDSGQGGCRPPRHGCQGVFGILKDANEIRLVCCRQVAGQPHPTITTSLVNDPDPAVLANYHDIADQISALIVPKTGEVTEDPALLDQAQELYDQLKTDADRAAFLLDFEEAGIWLEIQTARRLRDDHGDWGLVVYYTSSPASVQRKISSNSDLESALTTAKSRLRRLVREGPTQANVDWFDDLPDRDRKWLTTYAAPHNIAGMLNEAGVFTARDAGWVVSAYIRLRSVTKTRVAVARLFDPDLIAITTAAYAILDRWDDPNSADSDLEDEWNSWPDEERYALQALAPDVVAAWKRRVES